MGDFTFVMDKSDYQTLRKILNDMDTIDGNKAIKQGLNEGISNVLQQGKANLASRNNVKTGNLKKSISKSIKKAAASAGFRRTHTNAQGSKIRGGNHAHLIDRGTEKRWTKKGYYRGSVSKDSPNTGSMFWTDAVENTMPEAQRNLSSYIYQALNDITNRK